jgi:hypothetical protein
MGSRDCSRLTNKPEVKFGPNSQLRGREVGLGAVTTRSGVFQPKFVVHCLAEPLLAAEITLSRLNRCLPKQELNLLKFSAR